MKDNLIKFMLYFARWQCSTPILAVCITLFAGLGNFWATVVANAIGATIFYFVDKAIFKERSDNDTK